MRVCAAVLILMAVAFSANAEEHNALYDLYKNMPQPTAPSCGSPAPRGFVWMNADPTVLPPYGLCVLVPQGRVAEFQGIMEQARLDHEHALIGD